MRKHLQAINEHLMWEFGPAVQGKGHRLVVTPESRRYLRPLVRQVLERTPKLGGWDFYLYRLPEDFGQTHLTVKGGPAATFPGHSSGQRSTTSTRSTSSLYRVITPPMMIGSG